MLPPSLSPCSKWAHIQTTNNQTVSSPTCCPFPSLSLLLCPEYRLHGPPAQEGFCMQHARHGLHDPGSRISGLGWTTGYEWPAYQPSSQPWEQLRDTCYFSWLKHPKFVHVPRGRDSSRNNCTESRMGEWPSCHNKPITLPGKDRILSSAWRSAGRLSIKATTICAAADFKRTPG